MFLRTMLFLFCLCALPAPSDTVSWWRSAEDGTVSLSQGESIPIETAVDASGTGVEIVIDPETRHQSILGLGASLEHATCFNLSKLAPEKRSEIIRSVVHPDEGIGMNLMRICIGTSDFVGEPWYSYCDQPEGVTDPELKHFSIEKDRAYVLPVLKEALQHNPALLFVASPWSAPGWMKSRGSMTGGRLLPEYYDAFARYLVKFVQAYTQEGVPIHAITAQNEPAYADPNYPTTYFKPDELRDLVVNHVRPRMREAGLKTELWYWDHNFNRLDYPRAVLVDAPGRDAVDGVAFHFYEGEPAQMGALQLEYPTVPMYFTEGSVFRSSGAIRLIDILRNGSRSYNAWVLMLDEHRKPNNGPHAASLTPLVLKDDGSVERRFDYYMYGQFMRHIGRNVVRVSSEPVEQRFSHVAFLGDSGELVLVVANSGRDERHFVVRWPGGAFRSVLGKREVATYRWRPVP